MVVGHKCARCGKVMDASVCPCVGVIRDTERRRLARAIRGPLDRFDVNGSKLYADLRAGGVEHEAALLLVEAFARKERPKRREASRA
jgi:hypothetical protein